MLLKPFSKLFRETPPKHKIFLDIALSEMRMVLGHTYSQDLDQDLPGIRGRFLKRIRNLNCNKQ